MKRFFSFILIFCFIIPVLHAQPKFLKSSIDDLLSDRFLGNSIGDIIFSKNVLWISTSKGLSKSSNTGASWKNFTGIKEFRYPTIVSLIIKGDTIWSALVYDSSGVAIGGGFVVSTNGGNSWQWFDQAKDLKDDTVITYGNNKIKVLPVTVNQQNVTYGASFTDNILWINSWSSGLRKSTDLGKTFTRLLLPPDNLNSISPDNSQSFEINPRNNNNHLGFSVLAVDSLEIWAGSAGGVNKSTDGGKSWKKFTHDNQTSHILGDWVIHINEQKLKNKNRIWITSWRAEDPLNEEYGICYTEDGGETWTSLLRGIKANFLAFKDSIIYVATDNGIMRSDNDGKSFELFSKIYDEKKGYKILNNRIITIGLKNDTVFLGTSDGLVYTLDNDAKKFGTEWNIFRAYQTVKQNEAYAYPNPFSPNDESVRIHYKMPYSGCKVSIDIFDFGMNHIKNLVNGVNRSGALEQEEIWNGKDRNNNRLPNGVYFYKLQIEEENYWGKILVLE